MKRKFNLNMLCRRYSDGGATPPAAEPAQTLPAADPAQTPPETDPATPPAAQPEKTHTQSDVDEAVKSALEKYKAEQENSKDYNKMTAEQKVAYLEQAAKDRTLQDFTAKHLEESKIPKEFASFLKGADENDTKKRAADFKAVYEAAVQAGVEARFKASGYEPGRSTSAPAGTSELDTFESAISAAINLK